LAQLSSAIDTHAEGITILVARRKETRTETLSSFRSSCFDSIVQSSNQFSSCQPRTSTTSEEGCWWTKVHARTIEGCMRADSESASV